MKTHFYLKAVPSCTTNHQNRAYFANLFHQIHHYMTGAQQDMTELQQNTIHVDVPETHI